MPKLRIRLANAVIARLRELGTSSLRKLVASDEPEEQQFWAAQGFEADMVVMSNYDQSSRGGPQSGSGQ